jgi:hypothetical protein
LNTELKMRVLRVLGPVFGVFIRCKRKQELRCEQRGAGGHPVELLAGGVTKPQGQGHLSQRVTTRETREGVGRGLGSS